MKKRGEEAVNRAREEVKPSGGRVLGWMEMDGGVSDAGSVGGTPSKGLSASLAGTPVRSMANTPVQEVRSQMGSPKHADSGDEVEELIESRVGGES